jgi:3-isopropylmalate/(R)-2-methylmalate dehydratase small subunit
MKTAEQIRNVRGTGIAVRGNDIDTDVIMPARFLKSITFAGLEQNVFRDVRFGPDGRGKGHPFDRAEFAGASILVVNANFGCGSSREHAPQGLRRWGIRAIVGESFSEIFFSNCVSIGLPAVTAAPGHVAALMDSIELDPDQVLELDLETLRLTGRAGGFEVSMPGAARARLLAGEWDSLGLLLAAEPEIQRVCDSLPYVRGF